MSFLLPAITAVVLVISASGAHAQVAADPSINDSGRPGSALVFAKFIRGTVNAGTAAAPVLVPRSAFEVSVTCPARAGALANECSEGTRVVLRAQWVCPGRQTVQRKFACEVVDFVLATTVKGTVWFNPENLPSATAPTSGPNAVSVPQPPCPMGYLVVWVSSVGEHPGFAIKFDGLIGNAVLRTGAGSASAYNAVPIQGGYLSETGDSVTPFAFDGRSYQRLPDRVGGPVRYERLPVAGLDLGPEAGIETFLTLLTLDVNPNRPNAPVFVDLDFFNEVEEPISTSHEFVCWSEVRLRRINRNLAEPFGRKGLLESGRARKERAFGIPDRPGVVSLLGIVETKERAGLGGGATVREYAYTLFGLPSQGDR
jgi:hypothetical protein